MGFAHYRTLGLKFPAAVADNVNMQDRRTEVRMLCADMVEVKWDDGAGEKKRATGLLEDISPSGACLQLDAAVPLGTEIRWASSDHEFTGSVRYCVYREIGYFIGVEFVPESKWSKKTYKPQHLLDLKKLMG
jgi:hypothetical protein